jgi:hypothetical protein
MVGERDQIFTFAEERLESPDQRALQGRIAGEPGEL